MTQELIGIRRTFRWAYSLGLLLCVIWPLLLQGMLHRIVTPGLGSGFAEDLGYMFTGLVALSAVFVVQRFRRVKASFATLDEPRRIRTVAVETLLYSALFELSAVYGLIYESMGGPLAERYARSFIALSPVMFLVFVPRLSAWQKAIKPEP